MGRQRSFATQPVEGRACATRPTATSRLLASMHHAKKEGRWGKGRERDEHTMSKQHKFAGAWPTITACTRTQPNTSTLCENGSQHELHNQTHSHSQQNGTHQRHQHTHSTTPNTVLTMPATALQSNTLRTPHSTSHKHFQPCSRRTGEERNEQQQHPQ